MAQRLSLTMGFLSAILMVFGVCGWLGLLGDPFGGNRLATNPPEHDFGEANCNQEMEFQFVLENKGRSTIRILGTFST